MTNQQSKLFDVAQVTRERSTHDIEPVLDDNELLLLCDPDNAHNYGEAKRHEH